MSSRACSSESVPPRRSSRSRAGEIGLRANRPGVGRAIRPDPARCGLFPPWRPDIGRRRAGTGRARPDAPALDGVLLALARHHLGRVDEARGNCDRALERLRSDLGDEANHDVAIEALTTIRGLTVDEAYSLLCDFVFPADPFGPL